MSSDSGNGDVGTDGYASLEQYNGTALPTVDIFGIAATLFFLCTGKDPVHSQTRKATIDRGKIDPIYLIEKNEQIPGVIFERVIRALSLYAQDRPDNLRELISMIFPKNYVNGF